MPCIIELIPQHNHSIQSADSLRFRKVSAETRDKILNLFKLGHSPSTALESLKTEIHLNNDNFEEILADRKFCPDYFYVYHLYMSEFIKNYGPVDASQEFLQKRLEQYNKEMNENCVQCSFDGDDYCIW